MKNLLYLLKNYRYRNLNFRLLLWVYGLTILGINVIHSASSEVDYSGKQIIGLILGTIVLIICTLIDYKFVLKFYWVIYAVNLLFLLAVPLFGEVHMGAKRWINVGIQIQPSELTKIFLILFMAKLLMKFKDKINKIPYLLMIILLYCFPVAFILEQPDLSTSIVIMLLFCSIMFIGGLQYKIIGVILAMAIPASAVLLYLVLQPNQKILEPYQYNRIIGFYDKDNEEAARINYQQQNSIMAIGSGGLMGKGLNTENVESVKNGDYLAEPQTDFIFTIVGEELGFVGGVIVIILLALITFECFWTGAHAPDIGGKIICCGFGSLIALQSFVNIAVVTMLIPNTGLTLPFVSYGLSSLISMYIGIGFVMNVSLQKVKLL